MAFARGHAARPSPALTRVANPVRVGREDWVVPRISYFSGISIFMFANEGHHAVGHFHVRYAEHRASIGFSGEVLAGSLPTAQLRLARRWASVHEAELIANWDRLRRGQRVESIEPLA